MIGNIEFDYTGEMPEVFFTFRGIDMFADLDPGVIDAVVIKGSAQGAEVEVKFSHYRELQKAINEAVK